MQTVPSYVSQIVADAGHASLTYFTHRYVSTETIDVLNALDGISMITRRNLDAKQQGTSIALLG